jgi:hypothetical protein
MMMGTMRHPLLGSRQAVMALRDWPARRWLVACVGTAVCGLALGVPTDVVPNRFAHRVLAVTWWSYPTLALTALLGGLLIASYVRSPDQPTATRATSGGLLSFLAIGCPVCNKVVVLALGTTGAVSLWAPLQPVMAAASISLLGWALVTRLANQSACTVPAYALRSSSDVTKN